MMVRAALLNRSIKTVALKIKNGMIGGAMQAYFDLNSCRYNDSHYFHVS